ncbi:GYF domain-containing protein [Sandaracinus amylolyticus]|uniref:Fe-S oxidoreductase n=1 Tax=Sandaracinus amylolyticus TaxID=927083 RepID=A0A0F6W5Z0_9BACT|nr:GYF domain-containing protein [Sandaracinus amylolyticus]AKF08280.1 Fe-S oxidoreductase [Sandaracinus amylolyticus]
MKFLCPNCKAKYQIADEKVAGRTLKMDCRRCGNSIVLRADQAIDETSSPDAKASASVAPTPAASAGTSRPGAARPAPASTSRGGSGLLNPAGASRRTQRGGSHVGPAPTRPAAAPRSALGADFRRSVAAGPPSLTPEAPRTTALDQWHVAINDVPVGPMRREEISRKISTGAVTGDSLAWREGFDDWRPLKDIPELAALLRKSEARPPTMPPAKPPAPARPAAPSARPGGATASRPGTARPATASSTSSAATRSAPSTAAAARNSNVVPIGGRLGASAAPALDDEGFDDLEGEPTRVASSLDLADEAQLMAPSIAPAPATKAKSVPPPAAVELDEALPDPFPSAPVAAPKSTPVAPAVSVLATSAPAPVAQPRAERERRGLPVGAWMGIASALGFGVVMALIIAPRLLPAATPGPMVAVTTPPVATQPQQPREAPVEVPAQPAPEAAAPTPETPAAPAPEQPTETARAGHGRRGASAGSTPATTATPPATAPTKALDPAFARFADEGSSAGVAPIAPRPTAGERTGGGGGDGSGEGLEPAQVRAVVSREQRGLQSCWELAIRGMRDVPTTRMDVDITIGGSGTVTQATARGVGVGNLSDCIERNVRRWRFPSSGGSTQMSFPVVFQSTN